MSVVKVKENGMWQDMAILSTHTHTKDTIIDFPSSLPANGGNADTVDGLHASDLATVTDIEQLQAKVGDDTVAAQIGNAVTPLITSISNKVDKIEGSRLMTSAEATKLEALVIGDGGQLELSATVNSDNVEGLAEKLATKVDKVTGKDLSTNDYTNAEKEKLAGIATGATKTIVDDALSATSTNPVQNKVVNAAINNLNALVGDESVASQIATAMANKSDYNHTHNYAGSSSAGGAATSANKLNTDEGSATQPVYFNNGVPVKTAYSLGADVPSDAKFTDTVYTHPTTSGNKHIPSGGSIGQILRWSADGTAAWSNEVGTTNIATPEADGLMSGKDKSTLDNLQKLVGDTAVSTQINDALVKKSDVEHVHNVATKSTAGFMGADDKTKLEGIADGATKVIVDSALSSTSTNAVQNRAIYSALAGKAASGHTHDYAASGHGHNNATQSAAGFMSAADKAILDSLHTRVGDQSVADRINSAIANKSDIGHTHSAYVNQNAFSNVVVGSTTISADNATDTLTLVGGTNITLTPNANNDTVTIAAKDTVYTHPNSGVGAGTYRSVTVNEQGHVTGGSNPTTLSAYGITDAATKAELKTVSDRVGDESVSTSISNAIGNTIIGLTVSGQTITYTKGNGTTGTIKTQDTNTVYTHPTHTARGAGLYNVAVDSNGHVFSVTPVTKSDITALGIPAQDTTYGLATIAANGLMSASDKSTLNSLSSLVGDTDVTTQINNALTNVVHKVLTSDLYGKNLPSPGIPGRVFFKKA